MAADEQEAQDVVAVMRVVEPLGDVRLGVVEVRDQLVRRQRLALSRAADVVEGEVAADHDQPRGRVARRPVDRPVLQRAQAGFLESLLGAVEIAEIAEQRSDRLGTRRGES
jgi:hypothetical protein